MVTEFLQTVPQSVAAVVFGLICLYPVFRVMQRAGLNRWLSLLVLIPYAGLLIVMAVLAHTPWTTVPPLRKAKADE